MKALEITLHWPLLYFWAIYLYTIYKWCYLDLVQRPRLRTRMWFVLVFPGFVQIRSMLTRLKLFAQIPVDLLVTASRTKQYIFISDPTAMPSAQHQWGDFRCIQSVRSHVLRQSESGSCPELSSLSWACAFKLQHVYCIFLFQMFTLWIDSL